MAENDFIRLNLNFFGTLNLSLADLSLTWPPPERLYFEGGESLREAAEGDDPQYIFKRIRMSKIPDDLAAGMNGVARGAEYQYEVDVNKSNGEDQ